MFQAWTPQLFQDGRGDVNLLCCNYDQIASRVGAQHLRTSQLPNLLLRRNIGQGFLVATADLHRLRPRAHFDRLYHPHLEGAFATKFLLRLAKRDGHIVVADPLRHRPRDL